MNHPFRRIPPRFWWLALVVLLTATSIVGGALICQGAALKTTEAPNGLLSLQFAWTPERAQKIINSWVEQQQVQRARHQLYLDFLFLLLYPAFLSLSCVMLSISLVDRFARIGMWLSWIVLLAGLFDGIENALILWMLCDGARSPLSQVTTIMAGLKYGLVVAVFAYWCVAFVRPPAFQKA